MLVMVAAVIGGAWSLARKYINRGEDLNKKAWESSYLERGLPVPESGPREGYWGARLGEKVRDGRTVWREPEIHLAGLIDIDGLGRQYYRSAGEVKYRILIMGGSVASGANASGIPSTYFSVIGDELERRGLPVEIVIVAAGAWKSSQELRALEPNLQTLRPDLVVFLNGLNDLTNGSTSLTLYGEPTATQDGSPWSVLYHAHDYQQRVSDYLSNITAARKMTVAGGASLLVALQPSLTERSRRTPIEERLLELTLESHAPDALATSYGAIRKSLAGMTRSGNFSFLDCSRVLDTEKETVFTDIWHFTDFGHRALGLFMADKIAGILKNRVDTGKDRSNQTSADGRRH
ncbi:MAG: hypothetical protein A2X85_02650 [Geobacteraceae bacterium GWF2_54_21]|nr:MAG: hypothetical protein A2X85_02650 [Geobacteraceae bacterium GWF2_54_21]